MSTSGWPWILFLSKMSFGFPWNAFTLIMKSAQNKRIFQNIFRILVSNFEFSQFILQCGLKKKPNFVLKSYSTLWDLINASMLGCSVLATLVKSNWSSFETHQKFVILLSCILKVLNEKQHITFPQNNTTGSVKKKSLHFQWQERQIPLVSL